MIGAQPGQVSPDGHWRWDGFRWVAVQPPPTPLAATTGGRSALTLAGAGTSIFGAVVLGVGCALPYVHYSGDTTGYSADPSIFNGGFPGAWGNAVEPLAVILVVLAVSILAMAWSNRTVRALSAGTAAAMGLQTLAMFVGYYTGVVWFAQAQPGIFVGPLGGLIILVGGFMIGFGLLTTQ